MNKQSTPILFIIYILLFAGLVTQNGLLLALVIPFVVYLAVGYLFTPGEVHLQAERILDMDRTTKDLPVDICLKITNQGDSIEMLSIEDMVPAGMEIAEGSPRMITSLGAGKTVELNYALRGTRGTYSFPGVRVKVSDHLGLSQKWEEISLRNRILVLPQANKLPEVAIQPRRTRAYPGLIPARKGGAGVEFFGIREYRSGDPMRWINDRISARHDEDLFVNEFEQERAVDVGIILDCRTETNLFRGNTELLEHGIQAAATLADAFLSAGNRVGLLVYGGGRIWVHPGYGKIQRERIFQVLAEARIYDRIVDKDLANLPTRLFPARSQLVLISSLLPDDLSTLVSLRAHGYPLLVISPDSIEFEARLLGDSTSVHLAARLARLEREFLLQSLRRSGARVFEWQIDQPFYQAVGYSLGYAAFWQMQQGVHRA